MAPKKKQKEEPWQARLGTKVFNPVQAMEMQDAVRDRADSVVIDDRKFLLTYKVEGKVFYKPENGVAPCGYLNISHFLRTI